MRKAAVHRNGILAGVLTEVDRAHYVFRYDDMYFKDSSQDAISLTLSKVEQEHRSDVMFPFFTNMVAEGSNLAIQCRYLKIDENDILSLLNATASTDSIGNVTVRLIE